MHMPGKEKKSLSLEYNKYSTQLTHALFFRKCYLLSYRTFAKNHLPLPNDNSISQLTNFTRPAEELG